MQVLPERGHEPPAASELPVVGPHGRPRGAPKSKAGVSFSNEDVRKSLKGNARKLKSTDCVSQGR